MSTDFMEETLTKLVVKNGRGDKTLLDDKDDKRVSYSFYFVKFPCYENLELQARINEAKEEVHNRNRARNQLSEALQRKQLERAEAMSQLRPLVEEDKKYKNILDQKKRKTEPPRLRNPHPTKMYYSSREWSCYYGSWESLNDQLVDTDLDGIRKEKHAVAAKIKLLEEKVKSIDKTICTLRKQLPDMNCKMSEAYECLLKLRLHQEVMNDYYSQNLSLLNDARELAKNKDITALKELCHSEVDKFMMEWNNNKTLRDDYQRSNLISLDNRLLSRDGRIRNTNESEALVQPNVVRSNKNNKSLPHNPTFASPEFSMENSNELKESLEAAESSGNELPNNAAQSIEIDMKRLKEIKREEEIAIFKLALERKKRLAEKAMAKAALRAKRDADKKLKEREKRTRKKAEVNNGVPSQTTEPQEISHRSKNLLISRDKTPLSSQRLLAILAALLVVMLGMAWSCSGRDKDTFRSPWL